MYQDASPELTIENGKSTAILKSANNSYGLSAHSSSFNGFATLGRLYIAQELLFVDFGCAVCDPPSTSLHHPASDLKLAAGSWDIRLSDSDRHMSGRRGRKKATAKHQQLSQDADDDLINPESTVKPTAPAPPASPLVALATQAISPIVAAARAVTTAAAAVLPTIPEAAVAAQALDVDHDPDAAPRSPTSPLSPHATNNPFTAPATLKQTRSRTVGFGVATTVQQQHREHDADDLLKQNGDDHDQVHPCAKDGGFAICSSLLPPVITSVLARFSSYISFAIMLLSLLGVLGLALQQRSALQSQQMNILRQQQQVTAQAAALESLQQQLQQAKQQLQQLPDQQQLKAVAATCSTGLQDLNMTQKLLSSTLQQLETAAKQLAANITAVQQTSDVGVQAWEVLSAALKAEPVPNRTASQTTSAAQQQPANTVASAAAAGAAAGVPAAPQVLLLRYAEQQTAARLLENSQHILDSIPAQVKQEVQQQLAVKLSPLDVALADCGARVVFHTALNSTRLLQETLAGNSWLSAAGFESAINNLTPAADSRQAPASAVDQNLQETATGYSAAPLAAPDTPTASPEGHTSILHGLHTFIASHLQQLLQTNGHKTATAAHSTRDQQRKLLQHRLQQELMSLERISTLLLRPAGQATGSCLPLLMQDGAPAVVEIALPQMMEIHSVTLHSPASTQLHGANDDAASRFRQAPAHVTLALLNSSSCSTATSGVGISGQDNALLCSNAALRSKGGRIAEHLGGGDSQVDSVRGAASPVTVSDQSTAGDTSVAAKTVKGPAVVAEALLPDGLVKFQQKVQLTAENYVAGNGRVVVSMQQGRRLSSQEMTEGAGSDAATGDKTGFSRGVWADRLVVQVSASVGGGSEVCLQRISVQGEPKDVDTFC